MKKKLLVLSVLTLFLHATSWAYDFITDGIYYNIISEDEGTCEVTNRLSTVADNKNTYTGEVVIPETTTYLGKTYSVVAIGREAFIGCSSLTEITIPNFVTSIGRNAFQGCSSLTEITIPNSVTDIENYTFLSCSSLTEITIPNSVTSIGIGAFGYCSSLTKVTIPDSVTNMWYFAFEYCSSLTEVTIGNSVTSIEECAFAYCTSLTEVTIPNSVTSIGYAAFGQCSSLTKVTIPNSVTSIGIGAFGDCSNLTEVTIGNSVTSIEGYAFWHCSELTEVTIGNSVTSIGLYAFYGCKRLEEVTSLNPEPPTCESNTFPSQYSLIHACKLYVPLGAKSAYSKAIGWKDFYKIVEMTEFSIETLEATDVTDTSATLNGSLTPAYDEPIIEKGFEYWTGSDNPTTIVVESDDMVYTLSDLTSSTTYTYRAYATMESGKEYGDEVEFTTLVDTGINGISSVIDMSNVEGVYSTSGQRLNTTQKGVNIVRYSDGTTKKVMMK